MRKSIRVGLYSVGMVFATSPVLATECPEDISKASNLPKALIACIQELQTELKRIQDPEAAALSGTVKKSLQTMITDGSLSLKDGVDGKAGRDGQDGAVLKVSYASGNGPNDGTDNGRIVSRALRFLKDQDTTDIRISYSDSHRVAGTGKACRWTVKLDGTDCRNLKLVADRHDQNQSNVHSTSTIVGYCTGLNAGWHTVSVWVSEVPKPDNAYQGSDCYTGWDASVWTIEATELTATPHQP
ncbi:MAG: hypothetical protein AAF468_03175 [Pseudomonadota bacterium]